VIALPAPAFTFTPAGLAAAVARLRALIAAGEAAALSEND
jgi:hypothetical protein